VSSGVGMMEENFKVMDYATFGDDDATRTGENFPRILFKIWQFGRDDEPKFKLWREENGCGSSEISKGFYGIPERNLSNTQFFDKMILTFKVFVKIYGF